MREAVLAAGGRCSLLVVAGANHEDELFDGPEVTGAGAGFFRRHLAPYTALRDVENV